MSPAPVRVHRLRKKFRRGERHDSLRDLIPSLTRRLTSRKSVPQEVLASADFWAVNDVSFEVGEGEALGIIGPNGAGKSTMLKLLTRIIRPTSGVCDVRGRVGALIELAAGFHPDLTGRENVYLQGAIMGMKRREIASVLDEIIDFAGVESFIDTPVKRFSSGMNARLGFAIAAHLAPQVLVIDEVLAVGDLAFQEKCIKRMQQFKRDGVAIVFVSHNMQAISELCDRAIYLNSTVRAEGIPTDVISSYVRGSGVDNAQGSESAMILATRFSSLNGGPSSTVNPGTRLRLEADLVIRQRLDDVVIGFQVHRSTDGLRVYAGVVTCEELPPEVARSGEPFTMRFDFSAHVVRGQYHLECQIWDNRAHRHLARVTPAGVFSVAELRSAVGVADVALDFEARQMVNVPGEIVNGAVA